MCLWCGVPAHVTLTSEIPGYLAHWPSCIDHAERAVERVRQTRAKAEIAANLAEVGDGMTGRVHRPRRVIDGDVDALDP